MFARSGKKLTQNKRKTWKTILKIFGALVAFNLVVIIVGSILHYTYFERKYEQIKPYGKLVEINDGQMHIYSKGTGAKTIVLLPGMGVALPAAEFGPLMRKLSEKYTVVCLEYFGVGFSSITSRTRNCENYVDEIRNALNVAGFKPPYVLMPHSISSVYSEYYASKYPEEIKAIISLDGTSTAYYEKMPANIKSLLQIGELQQNLGVTSLASKVLINKKELLENKYTEKEINDLIIFSGFSLNNTVIDQISVSSEFIKQAMELKYPESVPFFKIISRQTYETPNKQLKTTPQEYQKDHLARIGKNMKFEILDGTHFIYVNNVDRIVEITDKFLKESE